MLYQIAEHTPDRLVVRCYWYGAGEARHMLVSGVVFTAAAVVFTATSARAVPGWVTALVILVGGTLGVFFLVLSRSHRQRFEEGLHVFDKRRGVFELCTNTERGSTVESYPLASVEGAMAQNVSDEGLGQHLVIRLQGNK